VEKESLLNSFDYIRLYIVYTCPKRKSLSLGFDATRPEINHHATIVLAHATRVLSRDTVSLSFPRNPFINGSTFSNGVPRKRFSIIMILAIINCIIYYTTSNFILWICNIKKLSSRGR